MQKGPRNTLKSVSHSKSLHSLKLSWPTHNGPCKDCSQLKLGCMGLLVRLRESQTWVAGSLEARIASVMIRDDYVLLCFFLLHC